MVYTCSTCSQIEKYLPENYLVFHSTLTEKEERKTGDLLQNGRHHELNFLVH